QMLPQKSYAPTRTWLRVAVGLFGLFLAAQSVWILLPERYRPNHIRPPLDGNGAAISFAEQDKIKRAASVAVVRGDLWAEAAFTYGGELWIDRAMELGSDDRPNTEALDPLTRALR